MKINKKTIDYIINRFNENKLDFANIEPSKEDLILLKYEENIVNKLKHDKKLLQRSEISYIKMYLEQDIFNLEANNLSKDAKTLKIGLNYINEYLKNRVK